MHYSRDLLSFVNHKIKEHSHRAISSHLILDKLH